MPSIRISMMAIRTTTIRIIRNMPELFAGSKSSANAGIFFTDVVQAYMDCRKNKRNTTSVIAFELNLERNLICLWEELCDRTYKIGTSVCFVVTKPKPREVWAANFRDRIVHHLVYNAISKYVHSTFISDSCACIPKRGTLYAASRLESKIRSASQNWSRNTYYLKMDISNFFVSINKDILFSLLREKVFDSTWLLLCEKILYHDPRSDYVFNGDERIISMVPFHKRLVNSASGCGLPIGNLSSQFFANVYMNVLDQHVKHSLKVKYYTRYVDDFILLHESPYQLNAWMNDINTFLPMALDVHANKSKTIIQPVDRGVDYVGQVIKPWRRTVRRKIVSDAIFKIRDNNTQKIKEITNSYLGICRSASHSHNDRAKISRSLVKAGYTVDKALTKMYNKHT
jgi:RNA-directed DNA polymerase